MHAYVAASIGAIGSLLLSAGDSGTVAGICAIFAVTMAIIATFEQRSEATWGSLALLTGSLFATHNWLEFSFSWNIAWLVLEQLAVVVIGWVIHYKARLAIWRQPSHIGPLVISGAALLLLTFMALAEWDQNLPALTFGLIGAALILTTLAVRDRTIAYAYAAGAAIIAAALCQLAVWGFRNPQVYAIPAGVYLLVLGDGLRRMRQPQLGQMIETGALTLLLGVTAGQALRSNNLFGQLLLLCAESLAVAGYGTLMRVRVPFIGGLGFFVFGVSWMGLNAARFTNQWVLLGIAGLLMVAAYVLLERHQERLVRAGTLWITRLRSWS
ncbi:MAG: hypothetical protein HC822_11820 [Oscillochloris sp.]|nr:hypothetical protein [Oscillochloris sp.]